MSDILAKLRNRQRPSLDYKLDLVDGNIDLEIEIIKLNKEIERKENKKLLNPKDDANNRSLASSKKKLKDKVKELEDRRVVLKFQALEPEVFEALQAKYRENDVKPDSEEAKKRDDEYLTELIALCSVEPKMDAKYVKGELFPTMSKGEKLDLMVKVDEINNRMPSANIPKELNAILDSRSK